MGATALKNPLEDGIDEWEAVERWNALPEDKRQEMTFIAGWRAQSESKKTNGKVQDHEKRLSKVERMIAIAGGVLAFLVMAAPFVFGK